MTPSRLPAPTMPPRTPAEKLARYLAKLDLDMKTANALYAAGRMRGLARCLLVAAGNAMKVAEKRGE